jgi:hypothetical protein
VTARDLGTVSGQGLGAQHLLELDEAVAAELRNLIGAERTRGVEVGRGSVCAKMYIQISGSSCAAAHQLDLPGVAEGTRNGRPSR